MFDFGLYREFGGNGGLALIKDGLLAHLKNVDGSIEDCIGESSITIVSGSADNLMDAEFSFDSSAVTLAADTNEGRDIFFDSASAMAPIVRSGAEWYEMFNGSYVWIGTRGIAIYDTDMIAYSSKIQRYLGKYVPLESMFTGTEYFSGWEYFK